MRVPTRRGLWMATAVVLLLAGASTAVVWGRSDRRGTGFFVAPRGRLAAVILAHRGTFWIGVTKGDGTYTGWLDWPATANGLSVNLAGFGSDVGGGDYVVGLPGWLLTAAPVAAAAWAYRKARRPGPTAAFPVLVGERP